MSNSIELIKKYAHENLDKIFVMESVTGILENRAGMELKPVENDAKTVYIPDLVMDGLGDYSMANGFPDGDVTLKFTPYQCEKDRGRGFQVDSVQDAESAAIISGNLMAEFERSHVIPEVDAYRLSKLYANADADSITSKAIAANTIISEFNTAIKYYEDLEIPTNRVVFFISTAVNLLIKNTTELQKKVTQQDFVVGNFTFKVNAYEGIPLVVVPPKRFKTAYVFGEKGFTPTVDTYAKTKDTALVTGKNYYTLADSKYTKVTSPDVADIPTYYELTPAALDISFMAVHTNAALPYKKHEKVRVFEPDTNQKADAWLFQYRLYHDIITPKNKQKGIYIITKPAA